MNTTAEQTRGLWGWSILWAVLLLSTFYFVQLFYFGNFDQPTTRQAIRMSARIGVVLFSFAFGASALHYFYKNIFTWWLRMNRRYIGISFAIMHLVHLAFLLLLQFNFHPVFNKAKTISLLGGGLAYFFVVAMLFTSFPFFSKYLSHKNWKLLHTAGGYWIWYIFIRSYVKRALTEYEYIPLVILLVVVLMLRVCFKFQTRNLEN